MPPDYTFHRESLEQGSAGFEEVATNLTAAADTLLTTGDGAAFGTQAPGTAFGRAYTQTVSHAEHAVVSQREMLAGLADHLQGWADAGERVEDAAEGMLNRLGGWAGDVLDVLRGGR